MLNKKWLAGMITLSLLGSSSSLAYASYNDIEHSYAKDSILYLSQQGVLIGKQSGVFAPKETVTRKQFAVMAAKVLGIQPFPSPTPTYFDIPSTDWSYVYIEALSHQEVIKGTEGRFHGEEPITREQAAVLLFHALGLGQPADPSLSETAFSDEASIAPYAKEAVAALSRLGILKGHRGYFSPKDFVTREQMAAIGKQVFDRQSQQAKNKDWTASPLTVELKVGEQTPITILRAEQSPYTPVYGWDHHEIGTITPSGLFTAKAVGKGFLSVNLGNQSQYILVKITE